MPSRTTEYQSVHFKSLPRGEEDSAGTEQAQGAFPDSSSDAECLYHDP